MKQLLVLCIFSLLSMQNLHSKEKTQNFEIAACMIFQNEAPYLAEWIEYHKIVGVEHFYLFNNLSDDNYLEVLEPYIRSGDVELFEKPLVSHNQNEYTLVQNEAYNEGLALARGKYKWLAIIDADEFIVPLETDSLVECLEPYENYGGLYVNWLRFGTSNVHKIPKNALMIKTLTRCEASLHPLGKGIVRPERVHSAYDPHWMNFVAPFAYVNSNHQFVPNCTHQQDGPRDKILIFHYYTRDFDHLVNVKYPRRKKWCGIELDSYVKSLESLNEVENFTMYRFSSKVKKALKERKKG